MSLLIDFRTCSKEIIDISSYEKDFNVAFFPQALLKRDLSIITLLEVYTSIVGLMTLILFQVTGVPEILTSNCAF